MKALDPTQEGRVDPMTGEAPTVADDTYTGLDVATSLNAGAKAAAVVDEWYSGFHQTLDQHLPPGSPGLAALASARDDLKAALAAALA